MPRILTSLASRLSFAHLAGIGAARASDDDDDGKKRPDAKGAKGDDDKDPPNDDDKKAKGAKADDGDERKKRDDETDDEYSKRMKALDDEDEKKAKGAKGAKGEDDSTSASASDDDSDDEMRGSSAAAAARRREQARCAEIFSSPAAGKNPVLAAKLAFTTRMPRDEAVAILEGTPAPAAALPSNTASRAERNANLSGGSAPKLSGQAAIDASWDAARAKNKTERRY